MQWFACRKVVLSVVNFQWKLWFSPTQQQQFSWPSSSLTPWFLIWLEFGLYAENSNPAHGICMWRLRCMLVFQLPCAAWASPSGCQEKYVKTSRMATSPTTDATPTPSVSMARELRSTVPPTPSTHSLRPVMSKLQSQSLGRGFSKTH